MIRQRNDAIAYMNRLGAEGRPFIFFTNFEADQAFVSTLPLEGQNVCFSFGEHTNLNHLADSTPISIRPKPIPFDTFFTTYQEIVSEIRVGNSFLTNLTFSTPIATDNSLKDIFHASEARFRLYLKDQFVCFSPEPFVSISKSGKISSFPMKGTIDAAIPDAEQRLLQDTKEIAEHVTIVDLIRNDLSRVAHKVQVPRFRYVDLIKSRDRWLYQTSSEISGQLPKAWKSTLGDILFELLPAGSITGAPKPKTVEMIKTHESHLRNFSTGVCGLFDGAALTSGVMIRFIEQTAGGLVYKSGAGITAQSDARKEYQEIQDKIYVPTP